MRFRTCALVSISLLGANGASAAAQGDAFAGWASLISTPAGAFAPSIDTRRADGRPREEVFELQYGGWRFAGQENRTNDFGGAFSFPTGDARSRLQLGVSARPGCSECQSVMVGADMTIPLAHQAGSPRPGDSGGYDVGFDPGVAISKPTGGGRANGYVLAVSASVPMSTWFRVGSARLVPFVSPGAGFGRTTSNNDSSSGFRMMLGAGIVVADLSPDFQISAGLNKIFIDQGPTVFGLGIAFGR